MRKSDKRKFKNVVKNAGLTKNYYVNVFAGGTAFLAILMYYAARLLGEVNMAVTGFPDATLSASLQDRVYAVGILFFLSFLGFLVFTVGYMIVLSSRVGGPIVAICAYIGELKKGNYDAGRSLRKNDELGVIMTELQELAEILKAKK